MKPACGHWKDCGVPHGGCCGLGLRTRPSLGYCLKICPENKKDRRGLTLGELAHGARARLVTLTIGAVPEEQSEANLVHCRACRKNIMGQCDPCGCPVEEKVKAKGEECPDGLWSNKGKRAPCGGCGSSHQTGGGGTMAADN